MIGHPKHSAPMRARVIGSHEPTGQRNYQTKPISNNQQGINGLRRVSGTAGKPGLAKPDGSLRRNMPRGIILHWTTLMYSSSGLWESGKPAGFSYRLAWLYATTTRPRVV